MKSTLPYMLSVAFWTSSGQMWDAGGRFSILEERMSHDRMLCTRNLQNGFQVADLILKIRKK